MRPIEARLWWLCPRNPRCPHGSVLHDWNEAEESAMCCVEGCPCGHPEATP